MKFTLSCKRLSSLSLFFFFWPCCCLACRILFPEQGDQGWNPCPLQWKRGVLTTGRPGRSLSLSLFLNSFTEIQFTYPTIHPLRCAMQWLLVCLQNYASITTVNFTTFSSSPKESPYLLDTIPIPHHSQSPSPWQPLSYFLSLWIDLF